MRSIVPTAAGYQVRGEDVSILGFFIMIEDRDY